MGNILLFSCPDNKLGRVFEIATRDVDWRIRFLPGDNIQYFVAKFGQAIGHRKNIVISATYPNRAVVFQLVTAQAQPLHIEGHHILLRLTLIPIAFIHTHHLAAVHRYSTVGQKIRRVGKYHVELEVKLNGKFLIHRNFLGVLIFYICDFLDNALLGNAYVRLPKGNQQRL